MSGQKGRKQPEPVKVSVTDAADRLGDLVGRARKGETVILTKYNLPVAQIVALDAA